MHIYKNVLRIIACAMLICNTSFTDKNRPYKSLEGAWVSASESGTEILLFTDGYFSHTGYNFAQRNFQFTYGGPYNNVQTSITFQTEFDTRLSENVRQKNNFGYSLNNGQLHTEMNSNKQVWKKLGEPNQRLAGAWHITQRMQNGQLQKIHQAGSRKTIKLLTGSRFQWVAIDPAAKGFYGTGGGTYTFENGKYTEHILFFSRDSSRVGASLSFDDKLQDGHWHHSGKSSKGEDIYEVWSKLASNP